MDMCDRVDPTDATFVDAIHTDIALIPIHGFGHEDSLARIDIYLNEGTAQSWKSIRKGKVIQIQSCPF